MKPILIFDAIREEVLKASTLFFDNNTITYARIINPPCTLSISLAKNIVIRPTGLYDTDKKPIYEFHNVKGVLPVTDEEGEPTGEMEEAIFTVTYDDNYARFVLEIQDELFSFDDYEKILGGKLNELVVVDFNYELLKEMAG